MLHIRSIIVHPDCSSGIRKNLQTDRSFVFNKPVREDFFAKNISLHAIVGKNGSGKSTLLELMFRMINNLSYMLLHDIQRAGAYPLRYVYGICASMDYEQDGKLYRLSCQDTSITWFELTEQNNKVTDNTIIVSADVKVPHVKFCAGEYPGEGKITISIEDYRELAKSLFYTVVVNYSMQAYVEQDFQGESTEWRDDAPASPQSAELAWVNGLFHKNDGYMCPIVLNPYRDKGKVDMNREMRLTQQRMEALLIYYKRQGIDYIDGYTLSTILFSFNPDVVCSYFDNRKLAKLIAQNHSKKQPLSLLRDLNDKQVKLHWLIRLFKAVMKEKEMNFQQRVLEVFEVNYKNNMDDDLLAAELYIICKIVNIAQKYPTYEKEKENILLEDNTAFDYTEILNPTPYAEYIEPMRALADKVKNQNGHIGLKVHRAKRFILCSQKGGKLRSRKSNLGMEFTLEQFEKHYWKEAKLESVEQIIEVLPPSIFSYEIMLEKVGTKEIMPMRQMSSGERQFVFSTSTIVYHLQNLRSVKWPSPRYKHFNIILDEVEICFHPEYQRTFVHKLLTMLTRLRLNNDSYINVWIVTHSPFILSDFPAQNILYLQEGEQKAPAVAENPFGANINDILRQSFFLDHGFMGEFSKFYVMSLCRYLYPDEQLYQDCPSMYKAIAWTASKAYDFIQQIGEPLLRTQLTKAYHESKIISRQERIEALTRELEELRKPDEEDTINRED